MGHPDTHTGQVLELEGVDPLSSQAFSAFMRALHLHRQMMMKLTAVEGSNQGRLWLLRILAAHDGMSQRDLAEIMHVSRPTVTTILQALEKDGVILRRTDESDQRLTRVHLTERGRELEKELRTVLGEYIERTFGAMAEGDRREFARLLDLMSENTANVLHPDETTATDDGTDPTREGRTAR